MVKKICYDVIHKTSDGYESRLFTIQDFIDVLKGSFLSWDQYREKCYSKTIPEYARKVFLDNLLAPYKAENEDMRAYSKELFDNKENIKGHAPLFVHKVFNFNNNQKTMFDIYVNRRTDFLIQPSGRGFIAHDNPNVEEGMLVARCYNYVSTEAGYMPDYVDISLKLHMDVGLIDSQMRAVPWFVDEWVNNYSLRLQGTNYVYVMSPLLHHCLKIYDKMLLLSKQKKGYFKPRFLRNAVEASFNDARILMGMNNKYKTINSIFVRVVPSIKVKTQNGVSEFSRFFNPFSTDNVDNAYSYSDVVTSGSGRDGKNRITTDNYQEALVSLDLKNIIFTKEENTNNGLFAWVDPNFTPLVNEVSLTRCNLNELDNHMITIDYNNQEYVTALYGELDYSKFSDKEIEKRAKKGNARIKLANSKTFAYDLSNDIKHNIIKTISGTDYFFFRYINYLNNQKNVSIENSYASNALVAFVDSDIKLPSIKEAVDMNIQELNEWMYSLRGVSCEGFFNENFLKQLMVVPRTERLKCLLSETNLSFIEMVTNSKDYIGKRFTSNESEKFLVREYVDCVCGGKIINDVCKACNNPRALSGELKQESWVDRSKQFDFVTITGIKQTEDGIDINVDYSIRLANARLKCEELSKLVPVETVQSDIGFIKHLRVGDIDVPDLHVPLDGVYFGLGGFKSAVNGIPFTVLRLYNALKNNIKFSSEDCVNNGELVNEFLKTFKKSTIITKMYDAEKKIYVNKVIDAWVGIVAVSPTEVSQEFNKSKDEENRNLSKANYALNNLLGFESLNQEYARMNIEYVKKTNAKYKELVKTAYIYNTIYPKDQDNRISGMPMAFIQELRKYHDFLVKDIRDLTPEFHSNSDLFNTEKFGEKLNYKQYVTYDKYKHILEKHPLFTNPKFENGFFVLTVLHEDQKEIRKTYGCAFEIPSRALYFPRKEILMNMFEIIGDNNVRISDLLIAFFGVFETLSVSKLINGELIGKNMVRLPVHQRLKQTYNKVIAEVLKAVNNELFDKEGLVNQMTNIAVTRMMSKQLTCIDCPVDVAIVSNNREYKKVVSKILKNRYPDKTDEDFKEGWDILIYSDGSFEAGWCWFEDVYCQATRQPLLFSKQNINVKQIWSSYKADIEYSKLYNVSFRTKHPDTKGIFLNSPFVAFNLEGDTDGDIIFLVVPETITAQQSMLNIYSSIKNMAFFDKENPNEIAKLVRETYLVPSLQYLIGEAENLNFKLDVLKIGYSRIHFNNLFNANFDASKNKENVGLLTVSLWYMTYFLDFYLFNFNELKERYNIPELSNKNKYEILFVFQYLLAQQNGVRAMKDVGHYGKLTYDVLVKDIAFDKGELTPRQMLIELINDYSDENAKENIEIDFTESINKLFQIFDNMFISMTNGKGFGFSRTLDYKTFDYGDSEWAKDDSDRRKYDCSKRFDKYFLDFEASFILINGRSYKTFVNKFSYEVLLKTLSFKNKNHLKNPLLSYYHEIFSK